MYSIWSSLDSVISFGSRQYVMNSLKHEVLLFKMEENYTIIIFITPPIYAEQPEQVPHTVQILRLVFRMCRK